ncbi:hypothetical protein KsCSTR_28300 [Candidatus Kuenenia stuttgartiensis]|uniref:Uncharacterized protein n=1 Tax=Kuenenia stuttgartiensis TaxID=174633 RepID=A0A6G7GSD1_KUEST|nr:hypothetical protein KsCSTR_28300 [Candidatus Kuenenia stuttgartiensis]
MMCFIWAGALDSYPPPARYQMGSASVLTIKIMTLPPRTTVHAFVRCVVQSHSFLICFV